MDQNQHGEATRGIGPPAHGKSQYQSNPMMARATQAVGPSVPSCPIEQPYAPHYIYQQQNERLKEQLNDFWAKQCQEIQETTNFKMDENQHVQPAQEAQGKNQYQSNPMMAPTILLTQTSGPSFSSSNPRQHPYDPQYMNQPRQERLQQQLNNFWAKQFQEIEETTDLRTHSVPWARIKKIMKAEGDVRMVSADAVVVFAKACKMFIMEITMRAWANAEENHRKTIKKSDIASAISRTDVFDFLVDTVPSHDKILEHRGFVGIPRTATASTPTENVPYYHMAPHQQLIPGPPYGAPRMVVGMPVHDQNHPGLQIDPFPTPMGPTPTPNPQNPSPNSDD